ncbi:universal stress protein [Streptomyces xanthii]|uniref:Universal stress protein n=1 Tax=Streptomyces xanthii TaxID=2768069 RepID=A0A7H1B1X2_9ACTN|nr:universal stress protein [Streptomyces xanthii]QNS02727.1 universal stress protein [Streptomyces xanthii]
MEAPLVVGVDGSEGSLRALDWAVDEAVRHGRPLQMVHASLWERYEGTAPAGTRERPWGQVLAENILGGAVERARNRSRAVTVTTYVAGEDAAGALLRAGRSAVAVIVGSRGRSEMGDLLLGSVGLVVAARSSCPVVVVRGDRDALEARHGRILLGVGEHDTDSPAVRFAFREAAVRKAELDAVHTWRKPAHEPVDHPLLTRGEAPFFEHRAAETLDLAIAAATRKHPEVPVRRALVEGAPHRVLTDRSAAADLLVLGAGHRHHWAGLQLGRAAHRALHHAACPVAIVPQHPPEEAARETEGPTPG